MNSFFSKKKFLIFLDKQILIKRKEDNLINATFLGETDFFSSLESSPEKNCVDLWFYARKTSM